ncbi:retropepsin-like aspartic protease [Occallatibacter savannae]|uniref:retropepsin-like aspartic protease n=1 Tax=Occallatibacter savannae TaxID=1002691 RepID=UPI0013A5386E|nr:retropepsin-like aspartic protease [Occallatibacter savannae]
MHPSSFRIRFGLFTLCAAALIPSAASAITCNVVKHGPPSEAQKALLAADFARAESLFRADLQKSPSDPAVVSGLFAALLKENKLKDAADLVKASIAAQPASAPFLTLRSELEFRQGEPWAAEQTALAAYKADPCDPRTRLLFARVAQAESRNATAKQQFGLAHQFDPEDPEIRLAWLQTLPLDQRTSEMDAFLSAPTGEDPPTAAFLHAEAERWKKLAAQPIHACKLSAGSAPADIDFIRLAGYAGHTRAVGIELAVNSANARLEFAGGEGGLTLYKPLADRAGLKRISDNEPPAFPGAKPTYFAQADKLKLGNLEFHDCAVKVIDAAGPTDDGNGTIGFDVFADFLETVDYPMRKLHLAALPPAPQDAAYIPALHTDTTEGTGAAAPHLVDRVVPADMKDWSQIYRSGRDLILPTAINDKLVKLFVLSISSPETNVAPDIAKELSKTYEKEVGGWGGSPTMKVTYANELTFNFAHFSQKIANVPTTDTSLPTRITGMEIGGNIGANTYQQLILHLDYRDALVKFEFIPDRGFKYQ